jgi:RimJ/RimL family protein N-acetyltransferase
VSSINMGFGIATGWGIEIALNGLPDDGGAYLFRWLWKIGYMRELLRLLLEHLHSQLDLQAYISGYVEPT